MQKKKKNIAKHLFSGAVAGAVSRSLTHPLERVKILRQTSNVEYGQISIFKIFPEMYKREGYKGFFKGNLTNVLRIIPFSATEFYTFEIYKSLFNLSGNVHYFFCGACAGMTASTISYPLDVVRARLSVQTATASQYNGITNAFSSIIKKEGLIGLYKGWTMTMAGIAPYVAFKMASFQILKNKFQPPRDSSNFVIVNMALGASAGAIAATLTHPTDLLRRKMQMKGFEVAETEKYSSLKDCISKIYKREGYKGFYRGLIPNYLKVIPSNAIAFMINEVLKRNFNI